MKPRICLLISFLTCISTIASAQADSSFLVKASRLLTGYVNINPVEKVYLHLDRSSYYPGDTLWFKAYTVTGEHKLSNLSGVLYCELINDRDSVVVRHVLKIVAGITWSDLTIPRAYKPGSYHIRAYTNWMRNAGAEYFFNQPIRILGPQAVTAPIKNPAKAGNPDVQIFPEGGDLVNGLRSRVAIKCVNANGLGEDIKGVITDNDGAEVASFATHHLGMGVFALTPAVGKIYKAHIMSSDSSSFTVDMPTAKDKGYTLTLNNSSPDSIYVKVAANEKQFGELRNSMFYLIAQCAGRVYYTAQSKLNAPVFTTGIAKSRFPSGIVQFTLFSQNGEALNERIVFVQNNDGLNIRLSSDSAKYLTRGKVKISFDTKSDTGKAPIGSFSVSVINESRVPVNENAESTILNNLLLTSDLKGYIEQPNYYFTDITDQKRADLDVLMLTQGYRRFEWKQILSTTTPAKLAYKPETDLTLEGTLKKPSGIPLPKGKVTLLATRDGFVADTVTDINGIFRFTDLNLSDTAKIVLRARKEHNGSNVAIYVKQQEYPAVIKSAQNNLPAQLTPVMINNLAEYQRLHKEDSLKSGGQLKEVKIVAKKQSPPDRFNSYGTALERSLDMARAREYQSVGEAVQYLAPGFRGKAVVDGLEIDSNSYFGYSWDEIQSVRLIEPNGFDIRTGRFNKVGYIYITTKRYAGTDTTILKEVVIKAKRNTQPDLSRSSNLHGGGNADQVIMGDKLGDCIYLADCLRGHVLGVRFGPDGTPSSTRNPSMRGIPTMSVIIDGIILPGQSLNDISRDDVYSVEVLRSGAAKALYGTSIEPGGALVITTRRTGDPKYVTSTMPSGLITYPFRGFHVARVFYSPKYDHPKTPGEPFDPRSTIYWNPNIITGADGKASFEYYNADTKGTYRVVVEGIDDDGKLGRAVYRYKVE